jgi:hypothetical protein
MEASPDGLARNDFIPAALRAAKDFTFGSIAGMVSKVFEHPFDLTKVRLQSQVLDSTARFSGPIDCLTQTWGKEDSEGCTGYVALGLDQRVRRLNSCSGITSSDCWCDGRKCVVVLVIQSIAKCYSVDKFPANVPRALVGSIGIGRFRRWCYHQFSSVCFHWCIVLSQLPTFIVQNPHRTCKV